MGKHNINTHYSVTASGHLTRALSDLSKVPSKQNGNLGWDSLKLDKGTFEIIYSLKFKPSLEDHIKDGAIWHVLNECARSEDFSAKYFLKRINAYVNDLGRKSPQSLVGITQINCISNAHLPKSMLSFDGRIQFAHRLTVADRAALAKDDFNQHEKLGLFDDFLFVITRASASDHRLAIDRAERNIKFGLGVLNLVHHGYGISKRFGYPNAPIGKFLTATPIFLIDRKARKLGHYFSDNNFPARYKSNFSVWSEIDQDGERFAVRYVDDLRRTDYPDKIIQAVILFQEGLEATGIDIALLKFWTGIELICSRDEKEISEKIFDRASSIFSNADHVKMRLKFINDFRNKIVHKGTSGDHAVLCAQWGSIILAELIYFCLFNKHKIRQQDDLLQYMSLPMDRKSVEKIIFLSKKRHSSILNNNP